MNNPIKERRIYFLDFVFTPGLRTLQKKENILQLRKKQSDVLTLLCDKYPNPVCQNDFLSEVWNGGYVTSQSIAQVIRSLRICLGDKEKNIIVTIPKLGYQLAAQPFQEESGAEKYRDAKLSQEKNSLTRVAARTSASINPIPHTAMLLIPYKVPKVLPVKKVFSHRILINTILFCSLLCVAIGIYR